MTNFNARLYYTHENHIIILEESHKTNMQCRLIACWSAIGTVLMRQTVAYDILKSLIF